MSEGKSTAGGLGKDLIAQMLAVGLGIIPVVFDTTIVNLAVHTLAAQLHAALGTIQWVTSGYLLAMAMAIPLSSWLVQRLGGKRTWLGALGLFLAGSLACGAAWNIQSLVAFRIVQGVGGGVMLPVMMTLFARSIGKGGSMGSISAVMMLPAVIGPMLGPVLCGVVLMYLDWRWAFWINVLPSLAALVLAWKLLPPDEPSTGAPARLDVLGVLLLSPGIAALLFGISRIAHGDGPEGASIACLATGAVLVALFGLHARRAADPLVDVRLLGVASLRRSLELFVLSGFSNYGALLLLPLYLQGVRGTTALQAGLLLVPQGLGSLLSRGLAGSLTDRIGPRPVVLAGFAVVLLGTAPLARLGVQTGFVTLSLVLVLRGFGLGGVTIPLMACAYRDMDASGIPHASTLVRIAMQLGGAFGTAALAVVLHAGMRAHPAGIAGRISAFDGAFAWTAAFTALAMVCSVFLPGGRGGLSLGEEEA